MATLDSFLVHLSSQDTKKKLAVGTDILIYLSIEDNTLECENISAFIDSIIHWLNNSNFKVFINQCFAHNIVLLALSDRHVFVVLGRDNLCHAYIVFFITTRLLKMASKYLLN